MWHESMIETAGKIRESGSCAPRLCVSRLMAVSCATMIQPPPDFLRAADNPSAQWLDTVVNVDVAEVRIINLPLTDGFAGMKLAISRADAPVESLKVSLHADR